MVAFGIRRATPWMVLACILAGYVAGVWLLHPTSLFGLTEDDSIYFSSARAIANGQGYVLPSVPGMPAATKYPSLFPWLLAWVWRLSPSFPANLAGAIWLVLFFGCAYLCLAFLLFRQTCKFTNRVALLLTAICALSPATLTWSATLMSDIPFAALALASCVVLTEALEQRRGTSYFALAGIVAGLGVFMRVLGLPFAVGLALAVVLKGAWRKAVVFGGCVLPFAATMVWQASTSPVPTAVVTGSSCLHSWRMSWLYYTSYMGFWRADTLANHVLWKTVQGNLLLIVLQPGAYFLSQKVAWPGVLVAGLLILVLAAFRGMIREVQLRGIRPIHFAAMFYLLPLVIWNYGNQARFLMPFLPLIVAGLFVEVKHLAEMVRTSWRKAHSFENKATAAFFCVAGACLLLLAVLSWRSNVAFLTQLSGSRATLLHEKRQAYEWLKRNSAKDARVLAYEDAALFLYTERQGMRPTVFSPAGASRPNLLDTELSCIVSCRDGIGANYWLVTNDDFGFEWEPANSRGKVREAELETTLPLLFQSRDGNVRIYRLASASDGKPKSIAPMIP